VSTAARFGRDRRILKGPEFGAILKAGTRGATSVISVALIPASGQGRVGISASTKVGGSVQRNRARRLVREYYRKTYRGSAPYDIVVNIKTGFAELSTDQVKSALDEALSKAIDAGKRHGRRPRPLH